MLDTWHKAVLLITILMVQTTHSSWWYLGLSSSAYQSTITSSTVNYRSKCTQIDVLAPHQRELCGRSQNILDIIALGAGMGIDECQYQFQDRRWNCTTYNETDVFGKVLKLKTREKAYVYAVSSAGVMYAITKACAKGELNICNCDSKVTAEETGGNYMWGGCSHNVQFGDRFAREFVDSNENRLQDEGLMNLWNNNAGRKAIHGNMKLLCKCHGVSGSCSQKICWRTMGSFRNIGSALKDKFDGAARVQHNMRKNRLKAIDQNQKKPSKRDLVYIQESPDFCNIDERYGILGTRGRECNKTSYGLDGCNLMCCGRGYHTTVESITDDCECKFVWCCDVVCQKCTNQVQRHFCN